MLHAWPRRKVATGNMCFMALTAAKDVIPSIGQVRLSSSEKYLHYFFFHWRANRLTDIRDPPNQIGDEV